MKDHYMLSIPAVPEHAARDIPARRAIRQKVETIAYADFGAGNGGFPINISELGMAFQGIQPLEKDQVLCIKFKLPGMKEVVETMGQVIWLNDLRKGGGLAFINLAEESRHLIHYWLSLQPNTAGQIDRVPAGVEDVENKEFRIPTAPPSAAREVSRAFEPDLNVVPPLAASSPSSFAAAASRMEEDKSAADLLRSQAKAEAAVVQSSGSKRGWILPFITGLITSVAIMIAVMVAYGLISIQFRWPQQAGDASVTPPIAATGSAKVVEPPPKKIIHDDPPHDQAVSGAAASILPSTISSRSPIVESAAPKVTTPELLKARTTSTPKVESNAAQFQQAAIQKAIAPRPFTPARNLDLAPPAVALPTGLEQVPRLSMASPGAPRPVLPASTPAPKVSNLEEPVLIKRRDPVYSAAARGKGVSGAVELRFTISAEGNVRNVKVIKGNYLLVHDALEAIQSWHYKPARLNGVPVESDSSTVFIFKPN